MGCRRKKKEKGEEDVNSWELIGWESGSKRKNAGKRLGCRRAKGGTKDVVDDDDDATFEQRSKGMYV